MYNDNPSLMYHPHYGFNPEVAYGQYSPVASPMPSIMFEGQMYSPHQIPFSPSLYPQPGVQNISSSVPLSPTELMAAEGTGERLLFGPGSGYFMHYGTYGGGNVAGNTGPNPITTPGAYPQPTGILGPYEHHVGQVGYSMTSTFLALQSYFLIPLFFPPSCNHQEIILFYVDCHCSAASFVCMLFFDIRSVRV